MFASGKFFLQLRRRGCHYKVKRIRNGSFWTLINEKFENFREDSLSGKGGGSLRSISWIHNWWAVCLTPVQKELIKQLWKDNVPMVVHCLLSLSMKIFSILFFSEQADEYSALRCKKLDGSCSVRIFVVDRLQSLHPGPF